MIYFVICAYNEAENIDCLLSNISNLFLETSYRIIFVDDGSTDDTATKIINANKDNIYLIRHKKNLGLGRALKTGLMFVLYHLRKEDIVITFDCDNTHPLEVAKSMVENISNGYDVVIGSRFVCGGYQVGVKPFRKFLSFFARILFQSIFSNSIMDYTSGFRSYSGSILINYFDVYRENFIKEKDFVVQLEILYKLMMIKAKIKEIPIVLRYDKKYGKSKLKIIKNTISYLFFLFKLVKKVLICN